MNFCSVPMLDYSQVQVANEAVELFQMQRVVADASLELILTT